MDATLLPVQGEPVSSLCLATNSAACVFAPATFARRAVGDYDVLVDVQFCGICHTDLHVAAGDTALIGNKHYPCVPGHELAGVCLAVGSKVGRGASRWGRRTCGGCAATLGDAHHEQAPHGGDTR